MVKHITRKEQNIPQCIHAFLFIRINSCKNIEPEIYSKFKNVLRIFRASNSQQHRKNESRVFVNHGNYKKGVVHPILLYSILSLPLLMKMLLCTFSDETLLRTTLKITKQVSTQNMLRIFEASNRKKTIKFIREEKRVSKSKFLFFSVHLCPRLRRMCFPFSTSFRTSFVVVGS